MVTLSIPAVLRGSEDTLVYSWISSVSKYIIWVPSTKTHLVVTSLNLEDHFFLNATQRYSPKYLTNHTRGSFFTCFSRNGDNLMLWFLELLKRMDRILTDSGTQLLTFPEAMIRASSSTRLICRSPFSLYHRLSQNPWLVRFLNMWNDAGIGTGRFAIAPYVTRCASLPRRPAIAIVDSPPTQFRPRRMSFPQVMSARRSPDDRE